MVKVLQGIALEFEGRQDIQLMGLDLVAGGLWQLDLLNSHDVACGGIQSKVDPPIAALAQELASDPLEGG